MADINQTKLVTIEETDAFQREEIEKSEARRVSSPTRSFAFERRKRLPFQIKKGLSKPGRISFETLRRAVASVHVARICVNVLKEKVTKTKWVIQPIDPLSKVDPARIKRVTDFFKYPNQDDETFRSFLDKSLEDLLVLDSVAWEKTRYPDGSLAELHYVDAGTIRPVYDEHGNQDILIPLINREGEMHELPVSYVQVVDSNMYGGPESGEIAAAWPKRDFVYFNMHPQGGMNNFGYGLSPIESVIGVVANLLSADNFNSSYFEEGSFPPILLQLMSTISQRELESLREYMYSELQGRFHRPAIVAGEGEMKAVPLRDVSQRDMQFMQYMEFMARLLAAAYGLSGQDIGLTDDLNRATAEVQKDLSDAKGYGSILGLLKDIFNQKIIWKDFGYEDIEFDWVQPDTADPKDAMGVYDIALKNGTMTINEVRQKLGELPYEEWADTPAILTGDGYKPIVPAKPKEVEHQSSHVGGEKPYEDQAQEDVHKSVYTETGKYKCWSDDRGVSNPFIFSEILSQKGMVIKPPVAVNLDSQMLEETLTHMLAAEGIPVYPVTRMTEKDVKEIILFNDELKKEFTDYQNMTPAYDSEKWRAKYGGSRKFDYYLVSEYTTGRSLRDPLLIEDMKRVPKDYVPAIQELAKLWLVEKKYVLGDRRADQVLITPEKKLIAIDFQFKGNEARWKSTKDSYFNALAAVPELQKMFKQLIDSGSEFVSAEKDYAAVAKAVMKSIRNKLPF